MGASRSKPSVSRASPPPSEPRSPPTASVLAEETRYGAGESSEVPEASHPPSVAAGPLRKRWRSALPEDGGCAKRSKDKGDVVVPDSALLNDDCELQLASAEMSRWTNEQGPESLLPSCQPLGAARDMVLGPSGSTHGFLPMSSRKMVGAKHKIFLSHAGAQKDFVDQLCLDLERMGYFFPFFDRRHHSLPKGEDFGPRIIEAARLCDVAVVVLSEEYLCSKWPMIELAEFYGAQQGARGGKLKFLPLFFKLSIEEVKDEDRWRSKWEEHADSDARIDLSKWSAAVKALCKSDGLNFGEFAKEEVAYRKGVVASIFKLSPPDFPFGSSKRMVGCGRMCEAMSTQFVEESFVGAKVLGVYGMAGLGKTMLAKALHDYFYGEYLGKVCYVDMHTWSRAKRQKKMLKILCGIEKDVWDCIGGDVEKGLMQMERLMKRDGVFLVLDNITNDVHLLQEVQGYLRMGFHPRSRIMITSSSKAILEFLLPNMELYMPMSTLMVEEARELFLKRAAPMKSICELTRQEQDILGLCIRKCWFDSGDGGFYHPMALTALGDFFSRLGGAKENQLLVWKDHLEKEMELVKDVLKSSKDLFGILGLQFSTFDLNEKLLFLDIALFSKDFGQRWGYGGGFGLLCRLHDISPAIMMKRFCDLRRSGMIEFDPLFIEDGGIYEVSVPTLYKKFARWYATDHTVHGLKNAYGAFQGGGMNMKGDSSSPNKSWSDLIRLRISNMTLANVRLVTSKKMQELNNLVVLHLSDYHEVITLNLEGLHCLRELTLEGLSQLTTITLFGNLSTNEYVGIYDSLVHVQLFDLISLVDMPNLRPCTSLCSINVGNLPKLRSLEGVDCPYLKELSVESLSSKHFESVLDLDVLKFVEVFVISCQSDEDKDDGFFGLWKQEADETNEVVDNCLVHGGACHEFLKKLCQILGSRSSSLFCVHFEDEFTLSLGRSM